MKIEVEKVRKLDEGKHKGVIVDVQYRDEPFKYTDVVIEIDDNQWSVGYPTCITQDSKLGRLLTRFGQRFKEGDIVDPNIVLVGRQCSCVAIHEASKKDSNKIYSKVVSSSVKPLEEQAIKIETDAAGLAHKTNYIDMSDTDKL